MTQNIQTTCKNIKHKEAKGYCYTCKGCYFDELKRGDKPYGYEGKHGFEIPIWCKCPEKCGHNTLICTICWKPVAFKKNKKEYYYV